MLIRYKASKDIELVIEPTLSEKNKLGSVGAEAVALVDGDLTSIIPEWLKHLVQPILTGYDLVAPFLRKT